jgi:hypothetical protein
MLALKKFIPCYAAALCIKTHAALLALCGASHNASSVTGRARIPSVIGKLFGERQMMPALATRDLPTTLRTNSTFTASTTDGTSVHLASLHASAQCPIRPAGEPGRRIVVLGHRSGVRRGLVAPAIS